MATPAFSRYADPRSYTCSDRFCPSTTANIVYCLSVSALDQTGEAEFTLFGALAEQVTGNSIHRVIRNNQPAGPPIANDTIAASRVRFPPPEVSRIIGNRYRFVVAVTGASFSKPQTPFMVHKVEAAFPKVRRLSSADTVIPATSWGVDPPMVKPVHSTQNASAAEPGPSNQRADDGRSMSTLLARNEEPSAGQSTQLLPEVQNSSMPLLDSTIIAFNRRNHKLVLDSRRGLSDGAPYQ